MNFKKMNDEKRTDTPDPKKQAYWAKRKAAKARSEVHAEAIARRHLSILFGLLPPIDFTRTNKFRSAPGQGRRFQGDQHPREAFKAAYRANPLNRMSNRQLTWFLRKESQLGTDPKTKKFRALPAKKRAALIEQAFAI